MDRVLGQLLPGDRAGVLAALVPVRAVQDPSSSMVPTLLVGDLILVNKFTYGIRLPVINKKIIEINDPQRGDVMVKYPMDMSLDYIKRVIGVPGDKITYETSA
jgi:signal peptidase I